MCEFCEKEKSLNLNRQFTDTNIQEIFLHTNRDGAALFIRQPMWKIEEENGVDKIKVRLTTDYAYLDIKFCPLCGRELVYKKKENKDLNLYTTSMSDDDFHSVYGY